GAGVQLSCYRTRLARERAEIVRASRRGEQARQKSVDGTIVEHAGWHGARQRRERFEYAVVHRIAQILQRGAQAQTRKRGKTAAVFAQCRTQEKIGFQYSIHTVADKEAELLPGRNAVAQCAGPESPGETAEIAVKRM